MSEPQYHDGYRTGCLPRQTKPGQWCPLFSSRVKVIPEAEWEERSTKVNLRPFVRNVYHQRNVGSCAMESTYQAAAIGRAFVHVPDVLFNPYGGYHFVNGGQDRGSTLDACLKFARDHGCFPEAVWPRSNGWQRRPDDRAMEAAKQYRILEFYDILTVREFVTALLLAFPVVYGADGHAVCATRHLHRQNAPEVVNSWGESWKDGGFGIWVPYARLANMLQYGAFAVRTVTQNAALFQEPVQ